jgi:hypothetical protein
MVLVSLIIHLIDTVTVASKLPYRNRYDNKITLFNMLTAYLFLIILQIFNQKHWQDFSEEDLTVEADENEIIDSELFLSPVRK